jgi:hypothetical protein
MAQEVNIINEKQSPGSSTGVTSFWPDANRDLVRFEFAPLNGLTSIPGLSFSAVLEYKLIAQKKRERSLIYLHQLPKADALAGAPFSSRNGGGIDL